MHRCCVWLSRRTRKEVGRWNMRNIARERSSRDPQPPPRIYIFQPPLLAAFFPQAPPRIRSSREGRSCANSGPERIRFAHF
jgi:hypothetical protein